jgi:hypothetical protein
MIRTVPNPSLSSSVPHVGAGHPDVGHQMQLVAHVPGIAMDNYDQGLVTDPMPQCGGISSVNALVMRGPPMISAFWIEV